MKRIESKRFYVAERDVNSKDEPTVWIVSKDEQRDFTFVRRGDNWVLVHWSKRLRLDYREVRDLVNRIKIRRGKW